MLRAAPQLIDFNNAVKESWEQLEALNILEIESIKKGRVAMGNSKVVICGITRDNAKELPSLIKYIEKTAKYFKDYRVIIFENDSQDGTKQILKNWQTQNSKVQILNKVYSNNKRPSIAFLAKARNHYLEYLEKSSKYKDFDILMVVDLDMLHGWDMRGLFDTFSKTQLWEAVCSNGIFTSQGNMWDMFAFRNKEFPESITHPNYWTSVVPRGQKIYQVMAGLIPVRSCFGGLAFYKKKFVEGCRYAAPEGDCEHVYFHDCLKSKHQARIFMNAAQIVRYSHYH